MRPPSAEAVAGAQAVHEPEIHDVHAGGFALEEVIHELLEFDLTFLRSGELVQIEIQVGLIVQPCAEVRDHAGIHTTLAQVFRDDNGVVGDDHGAMQDSHAFLLKNLAGLPTHISFPGIFSRTTAPMPMKAWSPIKSPLLRTAPGPTYTFSPSTHF